MTETRVDPVLTCHQKNRVVILIVFLPMALVFMSVGLYLLGKNALSANFIIGAFVVMLLWTVIWAIAAVFLITTASYRLIIDSQGITVIKLTDAQLIPWRRIRGVRVRGDTSQYGLYRRARIQLTSKPSPVFVEMRLN